MVLDGIEVLLFTPGIAEIRVLTSGAGTPDKRLLWLLVFCLLGEVVDEIEEADEIKFDDELSIFSSSLMFIQEDESEEV